MADTAIADGAVKSSAWATLLYPESCAPDFLQIIQSSGFPCLLSPLHDQDTDDDGCIKKPHYHLLIWFRGSRRKSQVEKLRVQLKGVGLEKITNPSGYARYLCHLDDLDKAHYSKDSVVAFGGLNYTSILAKSIDKNQALIDLISLCATCRSLADLTTQCMMRCPEYIGILTSKSYFFNNYISSLKRDSYSREKNKLQEVKIYGSGVGRQEESGFFSEGWQPDYRHESPFGDDEWV